MGGPLYQNWPNAQKFFGIWRLKLFLKFKLGICIKNLKEFFQCIDSILNYKIKCVYLGRVSVQPIHSITLTYYQFWYTLYQNCHRLDCFSSNLNRRKKKLKQKTENKQDQGRKWIASFKLSWESKMECGNYEKTRPGSKVISLINFEPFMGLKIGLTLGEGGGNWSPPPP